MAQCTGERFVVGVNGEGASFHVPEVTYARNTGKQLPVKGRIPYLRRL
jgi:hypothetical protein